MKNNNHSHPSQRDGSKTDDNFEIFQNSSSGSDTFNLSEKIAGKEIVE